MLALIRLYACFYLLQFASSSTLTAPPLSALVVAFESIYDLSLLANTLSDQGIDATLIIPTYAASDLYNKLIDVEVLQLDVDKSVHADKLALKTCENLFRDEEILKKVQEFQPTFIIFPALRYIDLKIGFKIFYNIFGRSRLHFNGICFIFHFIHIILLLLFFF